MSSAQPQHSVAPLAYRECAPSAELQPVVQSFWELRVAPELPAPYVHRVFPDGCLGLVFWRSGDTSMLLVRPPRLAPHPVALHGGECFWGLRVAPPSAAAFFGCEPVSLREDGIRAARVLPDIATRLEPQLAAAVSFEAAVASFASYVRSRPQNIDARIAAVVERIEREHGQGKIAELARAVRMSERQLQRSFRAATGLTPKQYARTRRLRAIAVELAQTKRAAGASWVERAAANGFADQAHLSRELQALTGRAPVSFADAIDEIDHQTLITSRK